MRRSHHALTPISLSECPSCGERIRPHRVCPKCGHYKDRIAVKAGNE
jgi:large subunit ribosomal protein L32